MPEEISKAMPADIGRNFHLQEIHDQDPEVIIQTMLNRAKNRVWMSTTLSPKFYDRAIVKDAFINTVNRVSEFNLLLDNGVSWNDRVKEMPWLGTLPKEHFFVRQTDDNIQHCLMIDSAHFRLEKEHEEGSPSTSNLIIWNADERKDETIRLVIEALESKFKLWWANGATIR